MLFYVAILGMAASGIGMLAQSGAGAVLFGASVEPLPDFAEFLPRVPHGVGARFMLALFALHAGAALYHHFIKRDGMIWRMWFGSKSKGA
ncbi:cytochrome b [Halocynthiibacter namhaensis]|uniref:cytochrome b n=1 Tax=Halocynthiibacter namhaensis TaxID=1290553 RepID=UPI000A7C1283|nr:cytochrome b/b6 domain-containing protein [Halocynthiibacter namhaensis]